MSSTFNLDEFINATPDNQAAPEDVQPEDAPVPELDVQKVVVEELAAEKAEMNEKIASCDAKIAELDKALEEKTREVASLNESLNALRAENTDLKATVLRLERQLDEKLIKELDVQERNPNALALLDRDVELPDRFPGETRDHVLEVVKEARDKAEAEGRLRRAQVLESVLVANDPSGCLAKKRAEIEKLFKESNNIVSGPVMATLDKEGISYKAGEEYLLPKEILLRAF